jgi:SNF2 family DNA or RNA helicase
VKDKTDNVDSRPFKLLPHQSQFVNAVLIAGKSKSVILRAEPGLGKVVATSALIDQLLRENPKSRVLVLCPAMLREQWQGALKSVGVESIFVDRYVLRRLMEKEPESVFGELGLASVLSFDFAKKTDVLEKILKVHWDLVLVDEAHRFGGARAELLNALTEVASRFVLCSAINNQKVQTIPLVDPLIVKWKREDLKDDDGLPINFVPRPLLKEIHFLPNNIEKKLENRIRAFSRDLERGTQVQKLAARLLLRNLESSPIALENTLQRIASGQWSPDPNSAPMEDYGIIESRDLDLGFDYSIEKKIQTEAMQALGILESLSSDRKLEAFIGLLLNLTEDSSESHYVCVLTDFSSTQNYLCAELENHGFDCVVLSGSLSLEERSHAIERFLADQVVLVGSSAIMSYGLRLDGVTDLILYDPPKSPQMLQAIDRFDTIGRKTQLQLYILVSKGDGKA